MDELTLPNLHDENAVHISSDLNEVPPFEALLNTHFGCEYTKKFLIDSNNQEFIENSIKDWTFKVDPKLSLSQSKIKSYWAMVYGNSCPETFQQSLTDRNISIMKTSPPMVYGQLFEYYATGQKNYTNDIPDESEMYLKSGKPSKIGEIIEYQAQLWKKFVRKSGFRKIETGLNLKYSCDKYIITSLPDIVCEKGSKINIIDLKFGDSEGTFGDFAWHDDKLPKKDKLLLQAKVNKFIHFKNTGENAPFIFYIANKANENAKAREIEFDFDKMILETEKIIEDTYKGIKFLMDFDLFLPTPEVKFCDFCKVKNCTVKTDIPIIKILKV